MLKNKTFKRLLTFFMILGAGAVVASVMLTIDYNNRASGFGGTVPENPFTIGDWFRDIPWLGYLKNNFSGIFTRLTITLPATDFVFVTLGRIALYFFKSLIG